jgi:hypothetical protein
VGGSRLSRGKGRGAGYGSLGTGEAQVSLARGKARGRPGREAHLLSASRPQVRSPRFLAVSIQGYTFLRELCSVNLALNRKNRLQWCGRCCSNVTRFLMKTPSTSFRRNKNEIHFINTLFLRINRI